MLMKLFFRGTEKMFSKSINEGWKNWMLAIVLVVISLGHIQQANAQNVVVDEILRTKYDSITLDPNKPIKENYSIIKSLLSLHKENNHTEYVITVEGHYVYGKHLSYNYPVGIIFVKDKDLHYTLSEQIIYILTRLYAHSLGKKFQVKNKRSEYFIVKKVNWTFFYRLRSDSPLYKKIQDKVVEEIN